MSYEGRKWVSPEQGDNKQQSLPLPQTQPPEPGKPAWDQGPPEGKESTVVLLLARAGWPPATRRPTTRHPQAHPLARGPTLLCAPLRRGGSENCSGVSLLALRFQCFSSILKLEHRLLTHSDEYCALGNRNADTSPSAAIPLCLNLRETALKTLSHWPP